MRQIVLDTETTGLEVKAGNRVIEIGCVELLERRPSGRNFHRYLNPDRDSEPGALRVHGLTTEFLSEQPRFDEVVDEFLDFIDGAELVIHNAPFDLAFLDAELERCTPGRGRTLDHAAGVVDTLVMAREMFPGQRVTLDALCRRFDVDASHRELHGALLDAGLLLDVYLALTSGQYDLALGSNEPDPSQRVVQHLDQAALRVRVVQANEAELALHQARLAALEKASGVRLWPDTAAG